MRFSDLFFWRESPIADVPALAEFIDEQAAFLVQKGIYEYSRARAGHYAKVLFSEEEFLRALEQSRWAAYPLGLAMVGEVVAGVLARQADGGQGRWRESLNDVVLAVFDRYQALASMEPQAWGDARAELARRLQLIGLHPPKRAKDIPAPYARAYWDLMPINKEIRTADFPTTHNYLKVTLCNISDRMTARVDVPGLMSALAGERANSTPVAVS